MELMGHTGNPQNSIPKYRFHEWLFLPTRHKERVKMLDPRLHKVDTTPKTVQYTGTDISRQQQQDLNPIEAANTWQQLNPTADPFASLPKNYYHTVTNAYATNIIVGDQKSPGMESIFDDDRPFIVLTETKFSLRCIPVGIGTLLTGLGSKKEHM
jgi:hypothetical protein